MMRYIFKDATGHTGIGPAESGKSLDGRVESWKQNSDGRKNSQALMSSGAERLFRTPADEDASSVSTSSSCLSYHFPQTPSETQCKLDGLQRQWFVRIFLSRQCQVGTRRKADSTPGTAGHRPPVFDFRAGGQRSCCLFIILPHIYNEAETLCQEVIFEICHAEALFIQRLEAGYVVTLMPKPEAGSL